MESFSWLTWQSEQQRVQQVGKGLDREGQGASELTNSLKRFFDFCQVSTVCALSLHQSGLLIILLPPKAIRKREYPSNSDSKQSGKHCKFVNYKTMPLERIWWEETERCAIAQTLCFLQDERGNARIRSPLIDRKRSGKHRTGMLFSMSSVKQASGCCIKCLVCCS